MAIRQVITFRIQAGSSAAFRGGFAPIVEAVRQEPGCEQYDLFGHVDEPDTFVMLERWRDGEAMQAALKKLYKGPDDPSTAFFKLVVGTPVRERYEVD
jgi:quinol monooxygenase YgiN